MAKVKAKVKTPFNIDWDFGEDKELFSSHQRDLFRQAEARWACVILGWPEPDIRLTINVELGHIDGGGNVIARVDPDKLPRQGAGAGRVAHLPREGTIRFDDQDLRALEQGGWLLDTITHEVAHVLGFGTAWKKKDLLQEKGKALHFVGDHARAEYGNLRGRGGLDVPVESHGDEDTRRFHWDQKTFDNEMMTGAIRTIGGHCNLISRITVASLWDLDYVVEVDAAEPYALPEPPPGSRKPGS